jgi:hypothetical protein
MNDLASYTTLNQEILKVLDPKEVDESELHWLAQVSAYQLAQNQKSHTSFRVASIDCSITQWLSICTIRKIKNSEIGYSREVRSFYSNKRRREV